MLSKIKTLLWNRKYIFLFITLFIIVLTQRFLNDKQRGLMNSVSSDGFGYYCYLPAAIIYQDFSYEFYNKSENKINPYYRPAISKYKDRGVNKYYCGTSICLLPFFLVGILISIIAGTDVNGYTDTFLMLVSIASIIYYLLSVFFISKIAKFLNISEKISLAGCLIYFFGTNLFHYTIQEPSMSHIYSFFAVSLFFYLFTRLINDTCSTNFVFLGLALGLVFLIRPVNVIIVLFTPFFFKNFIGYFDFLKSIFLGNLKGFFYFIISSAGLIFIQFLLYYFQTGDFFIVSYEGETFNFLKPEFFNVLFSYKKGLLLYVPILFGAVAFIIFTKNNWYKKIFFFFTVGIFLYITSSWWCWWYGGGFSIRPIIDVLPIFIITSILVFEQLTVVKRRLILFATIPFLFYSQLMAYQYSNLLIETDQMDKEKYWDVFMATDYSTVYENKKNRILKGKSIFKTELIDYEDDVADNRIVDGGYKSEKACLVGKSNNYSKGLSITKNDLNIDESFYLLVECMVKVKDEDKGLALAVAATQNEIMVGWYVVFKSQFKVSDDGWLKMVNIVEIDKSFLSDNSDIKIFVNSNNGQSLVDDLKYSIIKK
jgi:hypothetical protein